MCAMRGIGVLEKILKFYEKEVRSCFFEETIKQYVEYWKNHNVSFETVLRRLAKID